MVYFSDVCWHSCVHVNIKFLFWLSTTVILHAAFSITFHIYYDEFLWPFLVYSVLRIQSLLVGALCSFTGPGQTGILTHSGVESVCWLLADGVTDSEPPAPWMAQCFPGSPLGGASPGSSPLPLSGFASSCLDTAIDHMSS